MVINEPAVSFSTITVVRKVSLLDQNEIRVVRNIIYKLGINLDCIVVIKCVIKIYLKNERSVIFLKKNFSVLYLEIINKKCNENLLEKFIYNFIPNKKNE